MQPRQGQDGPVDNLAVSPDGRLAAVLCTDHTIRLWSLKNGQQLHSLQGHKDYVYSVAFSPDSQVLASASRDGTVRLWSTITGRELRRLVGQPQRGVYSVAFKPEGRILLCGGMHSGGICGWDVITGKDLGPVVTGRDSFIRLKISSDGKVLGASDQGGIHLWEVATGKLQRRYKVEFPRFDLTPDGRMVAIPDAPARRIRFLNVSTGEEVGSVGNQDIVPSYAQPFVFSPDGKLLAGAKTEPSSYGK